MLFLPKYLDVARVKKKVGGGETKKEKNSQKIAGLTTAFYTQFCTKNRTKIA
jgi:hypothetical protein